jgi:hypothetical protein
MGHGVRYTSKDALSEVPSRGVISLQALQAVIVLGYEPRGHSGVMVNMLKAEQIAQSNERTRYY